MYACNYSRLQNRDLSQSSLQARKSNLKSLAAKQVIALILFSGCEAPAPNPSPSPDVIQNCCEKLGKQAVETVLNVKATAYYPDPSPLEGGFNDRKGKKLRTVKQFLDGEADYVSIAMDLKQYPYGQEVCFPELNAHYNKAMLFKVVDTGGAFYGKGKTRVDICVADKKMSYEKQFNNKLTLTVCGESK